MQSNKKPDSSAANAKPEERIEAEEQSDTKSDAGGLAGEDKALATADKLVERLRELDSLIDALQNRLKEGGKDIEQELSSLKEKRLNLISSEAERLIQKEIDLNKREEIIREKELDAEAEFAALRSERLDAVKKGLESLREEQDKLELDHQANLTKASEEISSHREKERTLFLADLEKHQEALLTSLQEERESWVAERLSLADERKQLAADKEEFEKDRAQKEKELKSRARDLKLEGEDFQDEKRSFQERLHAKYNAKIEDQRFQIKAMDQSLELQLEDLQNCRAENECLKRENRLFDGRGSKDVKAELTEKEKKIEVLQDQLKQRPLLEDVAKLKELQTAKLQDEERIKELVKEVSALRLETNRNRTTTFELEALQNQKLVLETHLKECQRRIGELVERLEKPADTMERRIQVINEPLDEFKGIKRSSDREADTERKWLNNVVESMEASGFTFNRRLVNAFHTSLKIAEMSPLTVLAGVSGTGKSELPRLYCHFGGIQFAPIAVQPNWDSSQDLFGFFNYMDGKFNPKDLLRAMSQSQRDAGDGEGFNDGLLLVLLDEMNLARVEQYFSDLLSKLELRRGLDAVAIDIDLGSGLKHRLNLGRNILYTGTMNEDESTMTLSDKVIDRSNVISFPSPKTFHLRDGFKLGSEGKFLPLAHWRKWIRSPNTLPEDDRKKFKGIVEEINVHLGFAGRAVGHRVWQSIETYIANHPTVCEYTDSTGDLADDSDDTKQKYEHACQEAFEDQLVQKIMPKLRGLETEGPMAAQCIKPIGDLVDKHSTGLKMDFTNAVTKGHGVFYWHSAEYLSGGESAQVTDE